MGIGVLGPLTVEGSSAAINRRDRVVLAALAACRGQALSAARARERGLGGPPARVLEQEPPGLCHAAAQALGSRVHRTRSRGLPAHDRWQGDSTRRTLRAPRRAAPEPWASRAPDRAAYRLEEALALWRDGGSGRSGELEPAPDRGRKAWRALRLEAEELHLDAALRAG